MNRLVFVVTVFVISAFAVLTFGCGEAVSNEGRQDLSGKSGLLEEELLEVTVEQFSHAQMMLDTLSSCAFLEYVEAKGYLDVPPAYRSSVSLLYGGYIEDMDVLPGQKVKKGAPLFRVRNPEFVKMQQTYLELKEQLVYLKDRYERLLVLAGEKISAQKDLVKAEADYKSALASYKGMEVQLRMLNLPLDKIAQGHFFSSATVYAPLTGFVSEVQAHRGMYVEPQQVVLGITGTDHLHVELMVFEDEVHKLKKGQVVRFRLQGDEKLYEAEVYLIGKKIEGDERTVRVHAHIRGDVPRHFIPGMYVQASIVVGQSEQLCLPEEAVVSLDGFEQVLVLESKNDEVYLFRTVEVKTGGATSGQTAIIGGEGLRGQWVLTKGAFQLLR